MVMNFHQDSCLSQYEMSLALKKLKDFFKKNKEAQITQPEQELNLIFNDTGITYCDDTFPDLLLQNFLKLSENP